MSSEFPIELLDLRIFSFKLLAFLLQGQLLAGIVTMQVINFSAETIQYTGQLSSLLFGTIAFKQDFNLAEKIGERL